MKIFGTENNDFWQAINQRSLAKPITDRRRQGRYSNNVGYLLRSHRPRLGVSPRIPPTETGPYTQRSPFVDLDQFLAATFAATFGSAMPRYSRHSTSRV